MGSNECPYSYQLPYTTCDCDNLSLANYHPLAARYRSTLEYIHCVGMVETNDYLPNSLRDRFGVLKSAEKRPKNNIHQRTVR